MTAHRLRLYHSTAGAESYHAWLDQWLTNMQLWDAPEVTNSAPTLREPLNADTKYYGGDLAFAWSEDEAIILDQLSQYADAYCDWYRIGYHFCDHDEDNPTPCAWEQTIESGTVPDGVPTFK